MDHDLIYAKTAAGEGAMLQRTRVMQRNVRMVLILVDSQSTVADLCLKTGNPQLTESALRELELGGFIEPRVEPDSLWEEGNKVAQEIRAAASGKKNQTAHSRSRKIAVPSRSATTTSSPSASKAPPTSDWSISRSSFASVHTEQAPGAPINPDTRDALEHGAPQFATALPEHRGQSRPTFIERIKALLSRRGRRAETSSPALPDQQSASDEQSGWDTDQSESTFADRPRPATPPESRHDEGVAASIVEAPSAAELDSEPKGEEAAAIKPIRRGQSRSMGWPVIAVLGLTGALALAFLIILFFPYNHYLPEIEFALTNASGRPVRIGSMRVNILPKPLLVLVDAHFGAEREEIRIAEIRLQPVIGSMMAARKVFREAVVSGVSLSAERIAALHDVFIAFSKPTARVRIDRFRLEQAEVSFVGLGLSGLDGEAGLSGDGQFQSLLLRSADRRLSVSVTPLRHGLELVVEGLAWRPAQGSSFIFDSLNLKGTFADDALTIQSMELRIFDGLIEGAAVLRAEKTPSIVGKISFQRVNAARLGAALGFGEQFSGETAGEIRFSMASESWATIFSAIDADGSFSMRRGSLRGIDLPEAARRISKTPVQGGLTQFESLSGRIKLTPSNYQFSGLVMTAGLMQAMGYLDVSKDFNLSGKIELKMRGTANQTRVPLSISGPLKSATVQVGAGG